MRALVLASLAFAAAAEAAPAPTTATVSPEGLWLGSLAGPGVSLRIAFRLTKDAVGLRGTLISLDQSSQEIPLDRVVVTGDAVRIEVAALDVVFTGRLSGGALTGTFTQRGLDFPLALARTPALPGRDRPQEPKPPFPYREQEVTYAGAGVKLAGTLMLPVGKGPHPAVLLLTGSGAQNRDEEIFGHRPFRVLADALARRGIAVLRADDRGVGGSTGSTPGSTLDDYAADALAGIKQLAARPEIDAKRIGLLGARSGSSGANASSWRRPTSCCAPAATRPGSSRSSGRSLPSCPSSR